VLMSEGRIVERLTAKQPFSTTPSTSASPIQFLAPEFSKQPAGAECWSQRLQQRLDTGASSSAWHLVSGAITPPVPLSAHPSEPSFFRYEKG